MKELDKEERPIDRSRNTMIDIMLEGDVFKLDDEYYHVTSGEIAVFADGSIDKSKGEIAEVATEAVLLAVRQGKHIINIDEIV